MIKELINTQYWEKHVAHIECSINKCIISTYAQLLVQGGEPAGPLGKDGPPSKQEGWKNSILL